MRVLTGGFAFFACAALCYAAIPAEVPVGARIELRLITPVQGSAEKARRNVEAVVIAPVMNGQTILIYPGMHVTGLAHSVKFAVQPSERSELELQFTQIRDDAGNKAGLSARLVEVDNARETVDDQGHILGIQASQTLSARMDQGIGKLAQRYPGLADVLGSAKESMVGETDPNINYAAGVEMTIELTKPLKWSPQGAAYNLQPVADQRALTRLVISQPIQTMAARPPRPSDMTNMMLIGSEDSIRRAFQEAGWSTADQLNGQSKMETMRAIVELRGYKEGPVSLLLLDGRPPDIVFQKQNNTFAQRHHVRIWRRPGQLDGKPVWVCTATHDIGIDFSQNNETFIHRVDPQIDRERAKVVNDLLYTRLTTALALVDRPNIVTTGTNATGDPFQTDGKMAVVEF